VAQWWDDPAEGLNSIDKHIGSISVAPFIVELDGRPIGYIQSYDPHLEDGHPYQDQPIGTLGIDQFIGEPGLIGLGHGPRLIEAFVALLFRKGAIRVIIDPDPANAAAIRAYEKAGFERFDTRHSEDGPALLMARNVEGHPA
jgi:aminoglycoside 6'-N-acetyltransferase